MADEPIYSTADAPPSNKRKYEEPKEMTTLPPASGRHTGSSSGPISPDSASAHHPTSYNSVPPPPAADDVQAQVQNAKLRAQEIASRLLSGSSVGHVGDGIGGFDSKRVRVENGGGFESSDGKPTLNSASSIPISYGYGQGTSKKIDIPNGRVGVVIGKAGETIKYLQLQSGAKIQVTRDMDSDPNLPTRTVELMGTPEQIAKAEQLITDVLAEAEAGGSAMVSRRVTGQPGSGDPYVMKVPNNKVGLVIGKGGETIKNMQARTGAHIQVIPLHLPPGDASSDRNIHIDGTPEQIEAAKQLIVEVTSEGFRIYRTVVDTNMEFYVGVQSTWQCRVLEFILRKENCAVGLTRATPFLQNRMRNQGMSGGYPSHSFQARPPLSWGRPGGPQLQQPGYGYAQPGMYSGPSSQFDMGQSQYGSYPPPTSGGYNSSWDQSGVPPSQHGSQGGGYDYYSRQHLSQQQQTTGGPSGVMDNSGYGYGQPPPTSYGQPGQAYSQDGYGGYPGYPSSAYGQPPHYDHQGYNTSAGYNSTASCGTQGDSTQAPVPVQPSSAGQQGYGAAGYPQTGYGSQPSQHAGYGSHGPPQGKTPGNPPTYGQTQQSPSAVGGYGQPPAAYTQSDGSASQRPPPPSGYSTGAAQSTYGSAYGGALPTSQPGYGQTPPMYGGYGGGYQQATAAAAAYPSDGHTPPPTTQAATPAVVVKASPSSS